MATAADIIMAPSAARPETAGARKDAPAAAGETSFGDVLDAEVQTTIDADTVSDANAATPAPAITPPLGQLPPAPAGISAVELLISLQSADATIAQPVVDTAETTPGTLAAAPAISAVVTPEFATAHPAPAASAPIPATTQTEQTNALLPDPVESAPQAPAAAAAASVVAAIAPTAVQSVTTTPQDESAGDADAAPAPATGDAAKTAATSADTTAVVLAPAENSAPSAAPVTIAPAQAAIVAAAAPSAKLPGSNTELPAGETPPKVQPAANREAPAPEAQAGSSKSATPDQNAFNTPQTTTAAAKPQGGAQPATSVNAAPDIKAEAPAAPSPNTSTSFGDMLAATRGQSAETGRPAPTHPAMQSAPQAVAQVYTRFIERFDGRAQRFEVRLDPAELGRVDVRIEIGADRKVHAVLAAHDSAALTDLMRGQRALERALMDAGIDLKDGGVKFELANDSNRGLAGQEQRRDAWPAEEANVWRGFSAVDVAIETGDDPAVAAHTYPWRTPRLDLVA